MPRMHQPSLPLTTVAAAPVEAVSVRGQANLFGGVDAVDERKRTITRRDPVRVQTSLFDLSPIGARR